MSSSCVLHPFCPSFLLYNHIQSYVYIHFAIIISKKPVMFRSIKNNQKFLVYFYLILALCSSFLYVYFSFWPILLSFSFKDFIKHFLQCRCAGNKSPQIVFESLLLYFWRIILQNTEFSAGGFCLSTLNILPYSLFAFIVSEVKSDLIICVPLYVRYVFSSSF